MKKTLLCCLILLFSSPTMGENKGKKGKKGNVVYKYKQYESFDLGNLEIKGNLIAPGDLSVKERQRKFFSRELFDRDDFHAEVNEDIRNLR